MPAWTTTRLQYIIVDVSGVFTEKRKKNTVNTKFICQQITMYRLPNIELRVDYIELSYIKLALNIRFKNKLTVKFCLCVRRVCIKVS